MVETTPSISTSSRRRKPWSRSRYSSNCATGIGFCWSTFIAPSPRPIEKDARPPETACSVAIASAASSGWRNGTATAVPTFSVVVAAAASASTTYGSGSRPCASPTASPSQPLASNARAKRPISVDGTGVAPMRQNSARAFALPPDGSASNAPVRASTSRGAGPVSSTSTVFAPAIPPRRLPGRPGHRLSAAVMRT